MKRLVLSCLAILAIVVFNLPDPTHATKQGPIDVAGVRTDIDSPSVPGQFVVKFNASVGKNVRQSDLTALGGKIIDRIPALDTEVVEFAAAKTNPAAKNSILNGSASTAPAARC